MAQIIKISILIIFTALDSACTDTELAGDGGDVNERQDTSETTDVSELEADGDIDGECVPSPEICDGLDNDCDPQTSDGSEESRYQTECTPPEPNACGGYTWQCREGEWVCEQLHGPTGEAVDITYDMAEDNAIHADIAWDGSAFVVGYVAIQLPRSTRVYALRIDQDGRRLSEPEMLDSGTGYYNLSMGAGGGESLAVWYAASDIPDWFLRYARLNSEGRVVASGNLPEHYMFIKKPEVAHGNDGWLVVYGARSDDDPAIPVYALHIEEDGTPAGPPLQIGASDTSGMGDSRDLGVVATDTGYAVAWRAYPSGGVYALLLNEDGLPEGSAVQITTHGAFAPAIGFDGTVFGVSWRVEYGVYVRTFNHDGSLGCGPSEVSESTSFELSPSIVGLPGSFMLIWQGAEGVETNDGLYQVMVDADTCTVCKFSNLYCAETVTSTEAAFTRIAVAGSEPIVGVVFKALDRIRYLKVLAAGCE